eukprot:GHVT01028945.1.p1 GENE.GHVT01028945.1~~GHVT01028945.1.p1  ORF type:complete len:362 (+),score=74.92 GHVT01028945.1:1669-2754(+)
MDSAAMSGSYLSSWAEGLASIRPQWEVYQAQGLDYFRLFPSLPPMGGAYNYNAVDGCTHEAPSITYSVPLCILGLLVSTALWLLCDRRVPCEEISFFFLPTIVGQDLRSKLRQARQLLALPGSTDANHPPAQAPVETSLLEGNRGANPTSRPSKWASFLKSTFDFGLRASSSATAALMGVGGKPSDPPENRQRALAAHRRRRAKRRHTAETQNADAATKAPSAYDASGNGAADAKVAGGGARGGAAAESGGDSRKGGAARGSTGGGAAGGSEATGDASQRQQEEHQRQWARKLIRNLTDRSLAFAHSLVVIPLSLYCSLAVPELYLHPMCGTSHLWTTVGRPNFRSQGKGIKDRGDIGGRP